MGKSYKHLALMVLFGGVVIIPTAAFAQATEGQAGGQQTQLETVTVTAEKITTNVQDTPSVITAISGADMASRGITDIRDVQLTTPSLIIGENGTAAPLFLRGVGVQSNVPGNEPEVVTYVDGLNQTLYSLNGDLYDIDRTEVLYGPQGTLYGGDSTAGVMNIVTKAPTSDFGGYVTQQYGNYQHLLTTMAINVPLDDTLAVRIAGNYSNMHGYIHSLQPNDPGMDQDDAAAGRVSVLWKPLPQLTVKAKIETWQASGEPDVQVNYPFINPSNPWYTPLSANQWGAYNAAQFTQATLDATYEFDGGIKVEYIPTYLDNNANYKIPSGGADAFSGASGVPVTNEKTYELPWHQYTNELRVNQETKDYNWMAGVWQYDGNSNDDPGGAATITTGI